MNRVPGVESRFQTLGWLADRIAATNRPHTIRVAIDGVDGAGKTTLADELVAPLTRRGRPVIRASLDGFHNPRATRYRLGPDSPEGYYRDSFNYAALLTWLLDPLGPGGSGEYRTAVFDHFSDSPVDLPSQKAPSGAIMLFDGVFLLRPELRAYWDLTIFIDISLETAVQRAIDRDQANTGVSGLVDRYRRRYVPAQTHYLHRHRPQELADVVFNNEDLARPIITER